MKNWSIAPTRIKIGFVLGILLWTFSVVLFVLDETGDITWNEWIRYGCIGIAAALTITLTKGTWKGGPGR